MGLYAGYAIGWQVARHEVADELARELMAAQDRAAQQPLTNQQYRSHLGILLDTENQPRLP